MLEQASEQEPMRCLCKQHNLKSAPLIQSESVEMLKGFFALQDVHILFIPTPYNISIFLVHRNL